MIFKDQKDVNTFLKHHRNSAELIKSMSLPVDAVPEDTGVYRKVERANLVFLDRRMQIDEYGNVKDLDTFEDVAVTDVKINNNPEVAIMFRNSNNSKVYKRVNHLIAMAFLKKDCPKRIRTTSKDYRVTMLDNLAHVRKEKISNLSKILVMPFTSQDQMTEFCVLNDIRDANEFKESLGLDDNTFKTSNAGHFLIGKGEYTPTLSDPVRYYGKVMKISECGGIYLESKTGYKLCQSRKMVDGRIVASIYCDDGVTREVIVSNLVAKAFLGLNSKRVIKYIDGNPHNTCVDNLWYTGCGKEFGF